MADQYDLERFVAAQDAGGTWERAASELRRGRKTSHWMWFIFPQVAGLGHSATSRRYAISSLEEARAYLRHPVLGPRLAEAAGILIGLAGAGGDADRAAGDEERAGGDADRIFGGLDAQKLRSSMTLFHRADPDQAVFGEVLARYFGGQADPATDRLLGLFD